LPLHAFRRAWPGATGVERLALGVDPDTARRDAEGIEHHVSEQTLALFDAFVRKAEGGSAER